jgi:hypothetical protein
MPTLERPEAPPHPIACGTCGKEMRLASVVPIAQRTVFTYQCANGHRHKIARADKKSAELPLFRRDRERHSQVAPRAP